jgi:hypothetical protein
MRLRGGGNKLTTFEEREVFFLTSGSDFTCCLGILEKETNFGVGQFPTLCSFLSERQKNEEGLSELEKRVGAIFLKAINSPSTIGIVKKRQGSFMAVQEKRALSFLLIRRGCGPGIAQMELKTASSNL